MPTDKEHLFHAIHVGAAARDIPEELEKLLAPGGRLVIPVGPHHSTDRLSASRDQQVLLLACNSTVCQSRHSLRCNFRGSERWTC
ncbi:MAG: hypothetical protein HC767_08560 [Akkermansiaceae bacterium]|nr:hypothetical protein [Akkermansiaceae bacterium]